MRFSCISVYNSILFIKSKNRRTWKRVHLFILLADLLPSKIRCCLTMSNILFGSSNVYRHFDIARQQVCTENCKKKECIRLARIFRISPRKVGELLWDNTCTFIAVSSIKSKVLRCKNVNWPHLSHQKEGIQYSCRANYVAMLLVISSIFFLAS